MENCELLSSEELLSKKIDERLLVTVHESLLSIEDCNSWIGVSWKN